MDEQINKKKDDSSHDLYKFCQLKCRIPCQMSEEQTITRVGTAIVAHIRGRFYLPRLRQHVFDQPRRKQISSLAARVMILRYHHLIIQISIYGHILRCRSDSQTHKQSRQVSPRGNIRIQNGKFMLDVSIYHIGSVWSRRPENLKFETAAQSRPSAPLYI